MMSPTGNRNPHDSAKETRFFQVADLVFAITFVGYDDGFRFLPSFLPFERGTCDDSPVLFSMTVDDSIRPVSRTQRERIKEVDTGNGVTIVDQIQNGGYQFIIKDVNAEECALLITDKGFAQCRCALKGNAITRSYGLNNALMLMYAFAGAYKDTVLMHASVVRQGGYGYAFIAQSGTGKSTQVSNWLKYIPGCDMMNDDNPVVRIVGDKCFIYGSPWSGKTPCYRNVKAPLGAVTRIDRQSSNSVERVSAVQAFVFLLPSVSCMKWDVDLFHRICQTITRIVERTPIYILHCLPDRNSAEVCHETIARKDNVQNQQHEADRYIQ